MQRAVPGAGGSHSLSGATSFHSAHNPTLSSLPAIPPPIVVSSPGLRRRLEVGTGSIKIPSIWSQDSQLTYCPQQIYTTRGAKKKIMKIEFDKKKVIKNDTGKKLQGENSKKKPFNPFTHKFKRYKLSGMIEQVFIKDIGKDKSMT